MFEWIDYKNSNDFDLQDALANWNGVRIDPYLVWAYSTDFKYLEVEYKNNEKLLPLVIELKEEYSSANPADMETLEQLLVGADALPFHRLLPKTKYLTAKMPESQFFALLRSSEMAVLIERFELGLAAKSAFDERELNRSAAEFMAYSMDSDPRADEISVARILPELRPIIGIIDDGVAYLNQRFQDSHQGTRIQFLWDQNSVPNDPTTADLSDAEKESTEHGRLFLKSKIDELIQECYTGDATYPTMEERIYARENTRGLTRTVSHGTHLLDIAAGENPDTVPLHHDKEIVAVQLPQPDRKFSDTSGNWLKISAYQALQFLILAANQVSALNRPMRPEPVERDLVVNLSFGNLAGPHDGSSVLERGIDFLIESAPELPNLKSVSVHIAAGNQRQAQCYAKTQITKDNPAKFHWKILPDDTTPNFLELWFDDAVNQQDLSIEIIPPIELSASNINETEFLVGSGLCHVLQDSRSQTVVCTCLSLEKDRNATGDKTMALIAVAPTSLGSSTTHAPAGVWEVVVHNKGNTPTDVSAWIQRDDSSSGSPVRGRQSYFADPDYASTDEMGYPASHDQQQKGYVSQSDTRNGIATGEHVTTVGAYRYSGRATVEYSGYKTEAVDDERVDRFVHAIAEDSLTCPGVIGSGSRSGSAVSMNGTSVANAVATRHRYERDVIDAVSLNQSYLTKIWDLEKKRMRVDVED